MNLKIFTSIMDRIKKWIENDDKFYEAIDAITKDFYGFLYEDQINTVIELLRINMGFNEEQDDVLYKYIYDLQFGKLGNIIQINKDKCITINNLNDLYLYLSSKIEIDTITKDQNKYNVFDGV